MPVQVDGTQKDQLCQLLHHLNEMIILREHMNRDAQLLAPGPTGVEGGFVRKFWLLLDWISVGGGDKAQERERVHPCNVCDKAFKSLPTPRQQQIL